MLTKQNNNKKILGHIQCKVLLCPAAELLSNVSAYCGCGCRL